MVRGRLRRVRVLMRLRIEAGDKLNEALEELPVKPENSVNKEDAQRILRSIRDARTPMPI